MKKKYYNSEKLKLIVKELFNYPNYPSIVLGLNIYSNNIEILTLKILYIQFEDELNIPFYEKGREGIYKTSK